MSSRTRRIIHAGIVALGILVLATATANAASGGLEYLSTFSGADNPHFPQGFSEPEGLAVDQSNHHVYVADTENEAVDIFSATGVFQSELEKWQLGGRGTGSRGREVAVDNATGNVYLADSGGSSNFVYVFNSAGAVQATWDGSTTPSGSFGSDYLFNVAVDNSTQPTTGDVYVYDLQHGVVDRLSPSGSAVNFTATGAYINGSQLTGTPAEPFGYVGALAVNDANGDLYVGQLGAVAVFSPTGEYLYSLRGAALDFQIPNGIAVDPSTGIVYVGDASSKTMYVFSAAGVLEYEVLGLPFGPFGYMRSIGVDQASGDVYLAEAGGHDNGDVRIFGPGPLPGAPNAQSADAVTGTTATLRGDVNPEGVSTAYYFSYGRGASCLEHKTSVGEAGSGASEVPEEAAVTGLEPLAEYSFCFYTMVGQTLRMSSMSFTTLAAKPAVDDQALSVTGIGNTTATLHGTVNPNSEDTTYYFKYGLTQAYGSTSAPLPGTDIGAAFGDQPVADQLGGLTPGTTYHYQLVAINAAGESRSSPDETFTTLVPTPAVTSKGVSEVVYDAATVSGTITPNGMEPASDTRWCVEYGSIEEAGYGLGSVPLVPGDVGTGVAAVAVSLRLTGLTAGRSYRYRLVAVNSLGLVESGSEACGTTASQEADGAEATFTTPLTPVPPTVVTGGASGVSQNSATLSGTVDSNGTATNYAFQLGTDTSYGVQIYGESAAGSEAQAVSLDVGELLPGTTYHYRLVASNAGGSVYGADETFTTPAFLTAALMAPATAPLVAIPGFTFPVVPAEARMPGKQANKSKKRAGKRKKPARHRKKGSAKGRKAAAAGGHRAKPGRSKR